MTKAELSKYFSKLGRKGGSSKSPRKLEAIKRNAELARKAKAEKAA